MKEQEKNLDITKTHLGKLLATENIQIQHQKVEGPYFDVEQRLLVLPIWKNVDADLYDLMIGHEVGHALFTPKSGWTHLVEKYGPQFKTMLNLVEDARIEKKMKRKYPGLRKPMYNGYTQLLDKGFFGMGVEDMKYLPFADRVNCYFKLGIRTNITFEGKELDFVTRLENAETWDEIVQLAIELNQLNNDEKAVVSSKFFDLVDGDGEGETIDLVDDPQSTIKRMSEGMSNGSDHLRDLLERWATDDEFNSITDKNLSENQKNFIDEKSRPYLYLNLPKIDLSQFVVPSNIIHTILTNHFAPLGVSEKIRIDFINSNKNYINNMIKEFELRRNAKQFARAKVSKTGELDVDKVWKYKLSEDLFRQTMIVPNGKNHGMLMTVDMSGSMDDNIAGTLEQIVCMAMFCRKVNIPFEVYSFIDNAYFEYEYKLMHGVSINEYVSNEMRNKNVENMDICSINSTFRMHKLLHSGMSTGQFNNAISNILTLAMMTNRFQTMKYCNGVTNTSLPRNMYMSGTPLDDSILVLRTIAEEFKKNTKVEILTTVILTDGDSSGGISYYNQSEDSYEFISLGKNIVIKDKASKKQISFLNKGRTNLTSNLLNIYKEVTGSRVIGYYLMSRNNYKTQILRKYYDQVVRFSDNGDIHSYQNFINIQYAQEFNKHRYFGMKIPGYDIFYMIPGNSLEIEDIDMDKVLGNKEINKGNLYKAFKKMQTGKTISRVFVTRFVESIS